MSYKLTFNRPAVRQFIEGAEHQGLRIRVNDGMVQFMPSETIDSSTANLEPRTRGGYESVIEGNEADDILKNLRNPHGPFFILKRVDKDWVQAEPWTGKGDPPKFEPHVRVWHASQPKPKTKKNAAAPKRATSTVKVIADQPVDIEERVRWAYSRLGEERRPGRPSREFMEARAVVQSFEKAALEFMSNLSTKQVDLRAIVGAYHQITEFLREAAPEALHGDMPIKRRKVRVQKVEGHSDDDKAAQANREAEHMLGLDKKPEPVSRRVRGKVHSRAFGGESLVA